MSKMSNVKKYFEFKKVLENENLTELFIYGDITSWVWDESDVGSFNFAKELSEVNTDLLVHINSYGGEVAEGLAIYNLLKNFKNKVTTVCDGFACSAASIIFMAGNERIMNLGSLLMIHNAWTFVSGDSNALKKAAEDLEKITQPSIDIYKSVSNLTKVEIKEMMDDETWITADEALDYKFATLIQNEVETLQTMDKHYLQKQILLNKELMKQITELNSKTPEEKTGWNKFFNN